VEKDIDYDEDFHKIKVFSSEDEKLQMLGELLSSKSSRDIIKLLIEKEMYANEISSRLGIKFNLIAYHLKKMENIRLVSITEKQIVKKGKMHKFYKINSGIFLLPSHKEEVRDNGFLKKVFREGIKFTAVGIAAISTWVGTQKTQVTEIIKVEDHSSNIPDSTIVDQTQIIMEPVSSIYQIVFTIIVVCAGLFLIWYSKK